MTDRKLLGLAAKAAGLPVEMDVEGGIGWFACGRDDDGNVVNWWNPLKSDGDALRLSVKLGINLEVGEPGSGDVQAGKLNHWAVEWLGAKDPCAATRRAIVRAAAEIGREA